MRTVRHLAGTIGPRLATGPAFREAAAYVEAAVRRAGLRRAPPVVPGAGRRLVGRPGRGRPVEQRGRDAARASTRRRRTSLVGAHLDTVAVAPGAEDNASGVAVLLELARVLARQPRQVVLVAFGGEEPRGPGDAAPLRLEGATSRELSATRAVNLRAWSSLDRVGVGDGRPAVRRSTGTPGRAARPARRRRRRARRPRPSSRPTPRATTSRSPTPASSRRGSGSTPYAGYHSAARRAGRRRPGSAAPGRPAAHAALAAERAELPERVEDRCRAATAARPAARSRRRSGRARSRPPSAGRPRTSPRAPAPRWSAA